MAASRCANLRPWERRCRGCWKQCNVPRWNDATAEKRRIMSQWCIEECLGKRRSMHRLTASTASVEALIHFTRHRSIAVKKQHYFKAFVTAISMMISLVAISIRNSFRLSFFICTFNGRATLLKYLRGVDKLLEKYQVSVGFHKCRYCTKCCALSFDSFIIISIAWHLSGFCSS